MEQYKLETHEGTRLVTYWLNAKDFSDAWSHTKRLLKGNMSNYTLTCTYRDGKAKNQTPIAWKADPEYKEYLPFEAEYESAHVTAAWSGTAKTVLRGIRLDFATVMGAEA